MLKHSNKVIICLRLNSYTFSIIFVFKMIRNQWHFMFSEVAFILLALNSKTLIFFFHDGPSDGHHSNKLTSASLPGESYFQTSVNFIVLRLYNWQKHNIIRNKHQSLRRKWMHKIKVNSFQYSNREIFIDCEGSTKSATVVF